MTTKAAEQPFDLRPLAADDRNWIRDFIAARWGAEIAVAHDTVHYPDQLPGFAAVDPSGQTVGLVTYHMHGDGCEVVTIDSLVEGQGLGTALLAAVAEAARAAGCRRVWLITTNDNLQALAFYQKRGFRLVTIHRDAVRRAREIKPSIPLIGANDIPIQDEIERSCC
jgi:ribosomal protein S18 acetylase RimI-like enzyme